MRFAAKRSSQFTAELGPSSTFTCSSSVFRPVLIKILAPVPPLCCIMTSSSVMMQSLGAGRQAGAVEAEGSSPPIICHLLRGAGRARYGECTRAFKKSIILMLLSNSDI